jgi:CBS domain containing-hemolysin-like protein
MTVLQAVLLAVLVACFFASGFLSGSETAIVAIPRERLDQLRERGRAGARLAGLADDPESTIGTVLVANNFVNILATSIATVLATQWLGPIGPVVATFGVTAIVLVVGEITPKTMAARFPERYGLAVATPLSFIGRALAPISRVFVGISRGILRLLGIGRVSADTVTEADVRALMTLGVRTGAIGVETSEMIHALFEAADRPVREVMTPRVDVVALTTPLSREAITAAVAETGHSRYPVVEPDRGLDDLLGVIYVKDLLRLAGDADPDRLARLVRTPHVVPESQPLLDLLREFRRRRIGFAVVTDEHGGFEGVVTAKDVVGELVGELRDEYDPGAPGLVRLAPDRWSVDGRLSVEELESALDVDLPEGPYATVAGLFLAEHGEIPVEGAAEVVAGVEFTVERMDRQRVAGLRVHRAKTARPR